MKNRKLIESLCFDFDSKYLDFELDDNQNPSTWIIDVYTKDEYDVESSMNPQRICLGKIRWYAQWRQYGFYPEVGTVYEKTCLHDITKFVILMNEQQRKGIKPENPQKTLEVKA